MLNRKAKWAVAGICLATSSLVSAVIAADCCKTIEYVDCNVVLQEQFGIEYKGCSSSCQTRLGQSCSQKTIPSTLKVAHQGTGPQGFQSVDEASGEGDPCADVYKCGVGTDSCEDGPGTKCGNAQKVEGSDLEPDPVPKLYGDGVCPRQ